jgi:hypothetical protein
MAAETFKQQETAQGVKVFHPLEDAFMMSRDTHNDNVRKGLERTQQLVILQFKSKVGETEIEKFVVDLLKKNDFSKVKIAYAVELV